MEVAFVGVFRFAYGQRNLTTSKAKAAARKISQAIGSFLNERAEDFDISPLLENASRLHGLANSYSLWHIISQNHITKSWRRFSPKG
jgi:hypothetical protein